MLEKDLYPQVQNFLELVFRNRLMPRYGDLRSISAITANAGGPATGIWSKPDLCLITLWRHKYGLRWNLDLHGFEVKPEGRCTVQSVHEALSHTTAVHFSHLTWHCPEWDERDAVCQDVLGSCTRYGIGLITFSRPDEAHLFKVRTPARRHTPSPDALDEFVETRLNAQDKEKVLSWIEELR